MQGFRLNVYSRQLPDLHARSRIFQNSGRGRYAFINYSSASTSTAHHSSARFSSGTGKAIRQDDVETSHSTAGSVSGSDSDPNSDFSMRTPSFNYEIIRNEIMNHWIQAEASSPNGSTTKSRYCCFTHDDAKREYLKPSAKWHWLDQELSSNLAGETGAVHIYKGALSAMKLNPTSISKDALQFCHSHMANESAHLRMFQSIIPSHKHTKLLPLWKIAGWTLGFVPTMIGGTKALYVTVEAVETFVEEHFQEQILLLNHHEKLSPCTHLVELLEHCCEDEVHHKEDAARHLLGLQDQEQKKRKQYENGKENGIEGNYDDMLSAWWVQPWSALVKGGSALAAEIARRV